VLAIANTTHKSLPSLSCPVALQRFKVCPPRSLLESGSQGHQWCRILNDLTHRSPSRVVLSARIQTRVGGLRSCCHGGVDQPSLVVSCGPASIKILTGHTTKTEGSPATWQGKYQDSDSQDYVQSGVKDGNSLGSIHHSGSYGTNAHVQGIMLRIAAAPVCMLAINWSYFFDFELVGLRVKCE